MSEWYEIGLVCGSKVAKKVDALIKELHHGDRLGENYDPEARKTILGSEEGVQYKWEMKWNPCLYKNQEAFMNVLREFKDPEKACPEGEDMGAYFYKLLCIGDCGGYDEMTNAGEYDWGLAERFYRPVSLTFPESFGKEVA